MKNLFGFTTGLLLLMVIPQQIDAQLDSVHFQHLSGKQGLSHNLINTILQDREGFLWFGTRDGLNKYDGYHFTVYQPDPIDPVNNLRHNWVTDLHEDRAGVMWVVTAGGLHKVDKRTGRFTYYPADSSVSNSRNICRAIYEDQQGMLLITSEGGVNAFDPTTEKFTFYPPPTPETKHLRSILEDKSGVVWVAAQTGLYQLHRPSKTYTRMILDMEHPDASHDISAIYQDSSGILWIASHGTGLYRLDPDSKRPVLYLQNESLANTYIFPEGMWEDASGMLWIGTNRGLKQLNKKTGQLVTYQADHTYSNSLSNNVVRVVYQDRNSTVWIGTVNGIDKLESRTKNFHTYQITPDNSLSQLPENHISAIYEDQQGIIWLGTKFLGLYSFDRQSGKYTNYQASDADPQALLSNQVDAIYEDGTGVLWVGTPEGLHAWDRKTDKFTRYPSEIFILTIGEDLTGKLWIAGNGLASFDRETGKFTYYKNFTNNADGEKIKRIIKIQPSRTGALWLATTSQYLWKFDPITGQFLHYQGGLKDPVQNLNDNDIRSLYEDQEGILWIGTNQGGLNRFDPETGTFTAITKHDGLPSNHIVGILQDKAGNLWLSTKRGLCRFNPSTKVCRNYDQSDGLQNNQFTTAYGLGKKGELLFGGTNGFNILYADSIQDNLQIPPVQITGFKVLNEPRLFTQDRIELSYHENFFSFDFVALNYQNPEKNQYAYQLVGVDQDWVYTGTRRFANYTDLNPGHYTFRVKGSNNDGVWNEKGISIPVIIHPPWWQTWWAYMLYTFAFATALYGLRHYTVSRERLKAILKLKSIESEKLQEIDHLKSRFFANISHEFRTPLTLILGPLEKLLSDPQENKEHNNVYLMMYRNAQRLHTLINQLLDLSKLEAGSMKLEPAPRNLIQFLKRIIFSFTSLSERRQIQYHFQYPNNNLVVYFDADKLEKIIVNLLSNAFKFTPAGGEITVTARLIPADELSTPIGFSKAGSSSRVKLLELKVQDSGTGIAEDQQEKIFDRFYQADTSHTREQEGSGIGLALVKELVDLHDGEVAVESKPEQGSCFTVRLPLLMADLEEIAIVEHPLAKGQQTTIPLSAAEHEVQVNLASVSSLTKAATEPPLVLIVEDYADIRDFIRQYLHPFYKVIEATDGIEGYNMAVETIPDLILSDVMMPLMDGVELCRKLKADEKTAHVPVILLTAKASGEDKIEGLETGADDYIIKPFEASELLVRIKNLIESRKKLRERFSREITLQPASIAITSVDEKFLERVMQVIEKHMADASFSVEAFGREVGMSKTQLFRKLKALTNQSPGEFTRIIRLKRAAELLSHGAGSIAEVAFQVGFQDPSYFTKCFQKQFGQTPSEFMDHAL